MLFGLSSQQEAPPNFSKMNKYGVPHVAIFASSALLLVAALLNYIFPDADKSIYVCDYHLYNVIFSCMGSDYHCIYQL